MRSYHVEGLHLKPASSDDIPLIIESFTDRKLNVFQSHRFPTQVEAQLLELLQDAQASVHKQLLIARSANDPVIFVICSAHGAPPILYMAGVWPAWRGCGIFRSLAETIIAQCKSIEEAIIQIQPGMDIAIRQLLKLGFMSSPGQDRYYRFACTSR